MDLAFAKSKNIIIHNEPACSNGSLASFSVKAKSFVEAKVGNDKILVSVASGKNRQKEVSLTICYCEILSSKRDYFGDNLY